MAYISFQPSDHFNTKLYSGTGSSNAITGVGFQPDWLWIKKRNDTEDHVLIDAVRGASVYLKSNATSADTSATSIFSSLDSDGFTVTGTSGKTNNSGGTFASWNWKANGSGSANTDGSISSTVSANTTSGFSIVTYTGTGSVATVGHGLGAVPKMIMVKKTSGAESWGVYHNGIGNTHFLQLNTTGASSDSDTFWNDTTPTSSVFSIKSDPGVNGSGSTYIAYCFAEKKGFSKFGSYTGNGSTDGTFVYTGFKPAFLLSKMSSGTQGWFLIDNKRANPYNPVDGSLHPNSTAAEDTASDFFVDFTSNGFKLRDTDAQLNGSGSTYIYMAFAEHPLVSSNDIPAVAR